MSCNLSKAKCVCFFIPPQTSTQFLLKKLYFHVVFLPVVVFDGDSRHGARVAAQKQEGDVACSGDQVHQHGHANGPERRQVQLLHQQPAHEDPETGARNGRHTLKSKSFCQEKKGWYKKCVFARVRLR